MTFILGCFNIKSIVNGILYGGIFVKLIHTWIIFLISFLTLVPAKIYISIKDKEFVMLNIASDPKKIYFFIATSILITILIIMPIFIKNVPNQIKMPKNIFCSIFSSIVSIFMIITGLTQFLYFFYDFQFKLLFLGLLTLLCSITFIFLIFYHLKSKNLFLSMPHWAIVPTIWAAIKLSILFSINAAIDQGNIDMFNILGSAMLVPFCFALSKLLIHFKSEKLVQKLFMYGMTTALFISIYTSPLLFNGFLETNKISPSLILDLSIFFYIISLLLSITFYQKEQLLFEPSFETNIDQ